MHFDLLILTNFHNELLFLINLFLKNGNPVGCIDKRFETILNKIYLKKALTPVLKLGQSCTKYLRVH